VRDEPHVAIGMLYLAVCDAAEACGVDVNAVLCGMGLTRAELACPSSRLSPEAGKALGRELAVRAGDPALGLRAAALFRIEDLDLVGYVTRHSMNLLDALQNFSRYSRLLGDTADCRVERGGGRIDVSIGRSGGRAYLAAASDLLAGIVVRLVRQLFSTAPPPLEVRLPRPRPSDASPYRRFFGAPVSFGAPVASVSYPDTAAKIERVDADRRLGELLRWQADAALAGLPPDGDLPARLRAHLAAHLEAASDARAAALHLRMSERTLRRRLRDSGTSYRQLVDEVRRERALALFDEGGHKVTEVATSVGFADVSAFARAFRRWTHKRPHEYRR
jgi:AraC-like DNA-binding protein